MKKPKANALVFLWVKQRYIISIESGKEYNDFLRRIIKSTCSFPAWPGKFTACIDRIGIRYPCRICGRVTNLFNDDNQWFMEK